MGRHTFAHLCPTKRTSRFSDDRATSANWGEQSGLRDFELPTSRRDPSIGRTKSRQQQPSARGRTVGESYSSTLVLPLICLRNRAKKEIEALLQAKDGKGYASCRTFFL